MKYKIEIVGHGVDCYVHKIDENQLRDLIDNEIESGMTSIFEISDILSIDDSLDTELTDDIRKLIQDVSKDKDARTNRFLLSDELRTKEDWSLREFSRDRIPREIMIEEREMERTFEDAENAQPRDMRDMEINRNETFEIRNEERAMREEVLLRTHTNG